MQNQFFESSKRVRKRAKSVVIVDDSARALSDDNNFHEIASYRKDESERLFNNNPLRVAKTQGRQSTLELRIERGNWFTSHRRRVLAFFIKFAALLLRLYCEIMKWLAAVIVVNGNNDRGCKYSMLFTHRTRRFIKSANEIFFECFPLNCSAISYVQHWFDIIDDWSFEGRENIKLKPQWIFIFLPSHNSIWMTFLFESACLLHTEMKFFHLQFKLKTQLIMTLSNLKISSLSIPISTFHSSHLSFLQLLLSFISSWSALVP